MEIPGEIDESAKIDGCSNMGIFLKMILPLASSGLAAAAIFTFMLSWNEFLLAFILTSSPKAQTMPVFLSNFILEHEVLWDRLCAGGFIMLVPILAFSSIIQKYIIKGLSYGAIKG